MFTSIIHTIIEYWYQISNQFVNLVFWVWPRKPPPPWMAKSQNAIGYWVKQLDFYEVYLTLLGETIRPRPGRLKVS